MFYDSGSAQDYGKYDHASDVVTEDDRRGRLREHTIASSRSLYSRADLRQIKLEPVRRRFTTIPIEQEL